MSKTLETKRKILALLKGKDMTITGLSAALGLSNATVSQHIEELSRAGTIERVENEHFRKLKYYRIRETESPPIANYAKYLIATVIVLAVALEFYFYSLTPIPHQPANGAMAVRAGVNNSTYGQYAPGVIASEAVPGSFPASVANVLNASGADGFNFTHRAPAIPPAAAYRRCRAPRSSRECPAAPVPAPAATSAPPRRLSTPRRPPGRFALRTPRSMPC